MKMSRYIILKMFTSENAKLTWFVLYFVTLFVSCLSSIYFNVLYFVGTSLKSNPEMNSTIVPYSYNYVHTGLFWSLLVLVIVALVPVYFKVSKKYKK